MAANLLSGALLDDRALRVDLDVGWSEGRQLGRGDSGGQWRDDIRNGFDPQRGGQGGHLLRQVDGGKAIYVGANKNAHGNAEGEGAEAGGAAAAGAAGGSKGGGKGAGAVPGGNRERERSPRRG